MSLFEDLSASGNTTEMSNFAHVIFQNVAKSYLPHAALECHYTLTPHIRPHPKDWVGIFKVGWSTARDYYTFLWSPLSEKYVEGTSVNCVVVFQVNCCSPYIVYVMDKGEDDAETVQSAASDTGHSLLQDRRARFCFDSSIDVHKKCPLCEVIFPPNYDQSKFEEHVESHWKVCPICNEQFPLDYDQHVFEKHVQTHFDGNVLNFD
ncbi:Tax1-binding protein 1-like B [Acipenser ruthenus]|uniref:Tax1-binding protein 1-like B n=1 Tax=Acipenser ruthenus TaxID=7906 RepID=A0A444UIB8_ACIRT|nr:Tax1-binding protein 1-like B [Acipenser ruthenus]